MHQINLFRPTLLALSLAFANSHAQASMVRNDVDYQFFRDFAENKGQFTVGSSNIPVLINKVRRLQQYYPIYRCLIYMWQIG